jgi:hypothetical protein
MKKLNNMFNNHKIYKTMDNNHKKINSIITLLIIIKIINLFNLKTIDIICS